MLTASDIMEKEVISVYEDTGISAAVKLLLENHINGVPVITPEKQVVGILCQSDLIFGLKEAPMPPIFTLLDSFIPLASSKKIEADFNKMAAATVSQAMVKDPVTVDPETPVSELAALMVEKHFHTLPVVQDHVLVGIIGKEDLLKTMTGK